MLDESTAGWGNSDPTIGSLPPWNTRGDDLFLLSGAPPGGELCRFPITKNTVPLFNARPRLVMRCRIPKRDASSKFYRPQFRKWDEAHKGENAHGPEPDQSLLRADDLPFSGLPGNLGKLHKD